MDLREFVTAIAQDWITLMSGIASVVLLILGLASNWKTMPRWAFWTAAAVCFFCASARVWTVEHQARVEANNKLRALTVPQLSGQIKQITEINVKDIYGLLLMVSLTNDGADSIAEGFALTISCSDGTKITKIPQRINSPIILWIGKQAAQTFSDADTIYFKTIKEPIRKGQKPYGPLLYSLSKEEYEKQKWNSHYSVQVYDYKGHEYEIISGNDMSRSPYLYFPGSSANPTAKSQRP